MAASLDKFFNLGNLLGKKPRSVIGLDLGSSSAKVIQIRKEKGKAILETYGEIAAGPYNGLAVGQAAVLSPDKQVEMLRDLFREANVTTASASMAVPLSASLLVVINVPKVSEPMLAKVIPIEARKYIPVPISEVAIDWWAIPGPAHTEAAEKQGPGSIEALVVAIHNTVIKQQQELARQLGLQNAFFEIETFSAIRSVFGGEMTPTIILDIGAGSTKMAIVDYGIVRLSHTISKGAQDITLALSRSLGVDFAKAEEIKRKVGLVERYDGREISSTVSGILEYIFSDVKKVITRYQEKNRRAVSKIILIGSGSLLRGLLELAGKNFEIPVVVGKPFGKVEAPAFLENILTEAGPGFSVSLGLALRHLQSLE